MCSRYELLKQILLNNNKWCIYIDLDMIVRKNLKTLIKKIDIDTPIIYTLQPRSFKRDKNDEPYYLHKKRDKNTIFNTGLIAINNHKMNNHSDLRQPGTQQPRRQQISPFSNRRPS